MNHRASLVLIMCGAHQKMKLTEHCINFWIAVLADYNIPTFHEQEKSLGILQENGKGCSGHVCQ